MPEKRAYRAIKRLIQCKMIERFQRRKENGDWDKRVFRLTSPYLSVFWNITSNELEEDSRLVENGLAPNDQTEYIDKREDNVGKPDDVSTIPYEGIIEYLNQKTGRQFRHTSKATRKRIRGRWSEGFRLDDFKAVIDVKTAQWKDDPRWSKFLRPETLFLPEKFESYYNEAIATPSPNKITELQDRKLTDEQALQYLDYFQFVRDHYPRLFKNVKMLTASQYFDIRTGGKRYNALRRWFPANKMKKLFAQAHEEINTGLGIGRRYVDVKTELDSILKAPDYA